MPSHGLSRYFRPVDEPFVHMARRSYLEAFVDALEELDWMTRHEYYWRQSRRRPITLRGVNDRCSPDFLIVGTETGAMATGDVIILPDIGDEMVLNNYGTYQLRPVVKRQRLITSYFGPDRG